MSIYRTKVPGKGSGLDFGENLKEPVLVKCLREDTDIKAIACVIKINRSVITNLLFTPLARSGGTGT